MTKAEELIVINVCNYIKKHYPEQPFRVDLVDKIGRFNGGKVKSLHGKWSRGYPDLFLPRRTKGYGGLYLEVKATATVHNTAHTRLQAVYHEVLRQQGFKVLFACGYDECIIAVNKYMRGASYDD